MKLFFYFLFASLLLRTPLLLAQQTGETRTNNAGKDFWLTLFAWGRYNEFRISSRHNATVTFTYTANNSVQTFYVAAGTILTIPQNQITLAVNTLVETVQNKSLHITSDSNIVVHYTTWGNMTDDGMMICPSDRQRYDTRYFLNGLPFLGTGYLGNRAGGYSIVATCDSVTLRITPSRNTATHIASAPFLLNLNKGETYTITNSGNNTLKDLSGSKIEVLDASCCNPINVFNTGICGYSYWPYNASSSLACDHFLEQVLPVSSWDTLYPIVPYKNGPFSIFKIVSSAANNIISLDGIVIATLGEGECLDTVLNQPAILSATSPVSISQNMVGYATSYTNTNPVPIEDIPVDSLSDPNTAIMVPLRDGIREAYFHTVGQYSTANNEYYNRLHRLTLISRTENINSITLNNVNIAQEFIPFPSAPEYQYASIKPDTGVTYHILSDDRIIAYYYAATMAGSLDFHLGDVNPVKFYEELPADTLMICINDTVLLQGGQSAFFEWSTNETSQNIRVSDTGMYHVYTYEDDDCPGELKQFVVKRPQTYISEFDLGNDTVICKGDHLVLSSPYTLTEWSNGHIGDMLDVYLPGWYHASITDTCTGYAFKDSIHISDTVCLDRYCNFNLPNAFSPNGDGINDYFLPVYFGAIAQYNLNIYNRYGERIFSSQKAEQGWDGTHKGGMPMEVGVYYYHCRFYCPLKGYVESKGDITLLR
ncbi:MAG: gliding motility-associated C-terminal domain-containing protein [Taibaiella sp.]